MAGLSEVIAFQSRSFPAEVGGDPDVSRVASSGVGLLRLILDTLTGTGVVVRAAPEIEELGCGAFVEAHGTLVSIFLAWSATGLRARPRDVWTLQVSSNIGCLAWLFRRRRRSQDVSRDVVVAAVLRVLREHPEEFSDVRMHGSFEELELDERE